MENTRISLKNVKFQKIVPNEIIIFNCQIAPFENSHFS